MDAGLNLDTDSPVAGPDRNRPPTVDILLLPKVKSLFHLSSGYSLARLTISILSVLTETAGSGIFLPYPISNTWNKKKTPTNGMDWITKQERSLNMREHHGALKKPMQVVVWRWEAKGMSQRALAWSVLMPSWTWACGVHKALISCWQPEITALLAELRKRALEGLQDRKEEKINSEPHGVPLTVTFLTAATFLHTALPVNIEQVGFWLWEEDALLRYAQTRCKGEWRA